jgi:hypothetical protein
MAKDLHRRSRQAAETSELNRQPEEEEKTVGGIRRAMIALCAVAGCLTAMSDNAHASPAGSIHDNVHIDPAGWQWGTAIGAAQDPAAVSAGGTYDRVIAEDWNNTSGEKWKIRVVVHVDAETDVVTLQNLRYSNRCLDASTSPERYGDVYLYPCTGGDNQKWWLTKVGSVPYAGVYRLAVYAFPVAPRACLNVDVLGAYLSDCEFNPGTYALYGY